MVQGLKKILIISYFFPPANLAGSYRIYSWAKYLKAFGWYPIIVTRVWNDNQVDITENITDNTFKHEVYDDYEVYRLPYQRSTRDKLSAAGRIGVVGKVLTFWEILSSGFSNQWVPYKNLYDFSEKLLKDDAGINGIVVSGRPFLLFKFGYLLGRKFGKPWVVDYRDEWNTHQWINNENWRSRVISALERTREKRWAKGAALITTCSQLWANRLGAFTGNSNTAVIHNGYDESDFLNVEVEKSDSFKIVHSGTLYSAQNITVFAQGLKLFMQQNPGLKVEVDFPGLTYEYEQMLRIKKELGWLGNNLSIESRIPKKQLMAKLMGADVLLMFGIDSEIKGHHSSKIFEYLRTNVPILLSPSDNDVMQSLVSETNTGFTGNTPQAVAGMLSNVYTKQYVHAPLADAVAQYSRRQQTGAFATALDKYVHNRVPVYNYQFGRVETIPGFAMQQSNGITSICFHNISDELNPASPNMPKKTFAKIINHIAKRYEPIVPGMQPTGKKPPIIITFDDGNKELKDFAFPLLKEKGLPAMLFVVTDTVKYQTPFWTQKIETLIHACLQNDKPLSIEVDGQLIEANVRYENAENIASGLFQKLKVLPLQQRMAVIDNALAEFNDIAFPDMLNEADLFDCVNMGISIGSHSKTHDFLVSLNNPNSLHTELAESKLYLENLLGINVDGFAAPSGFSNNNIIKHALDVGYQQFYTVQSKYNMHPTGNVINRILMQGDNYLSNLIRLHGLGV